MANESDTKKRTTVDDEWVRPAVLLSKLKGEGGGTKDSLEPSESRAEELPPERVIEVEKRFELPEWVRSSIHFNPEPTELSPHGSFAGHPVIGGKSAINGGIYIGEAEGEAILIDEESGSLEPFYTELTVRFANQQNYEEAVEFQIPRFVAALTIDTLRHSIQLPQFSYESMEELGEEWILFDLYIKGRIGSARHQVLFAGYLFEKLIKRNVLDGQIFVDNGRAYSTPERERLIYTGKSGYNFIFEPAAEAARQRLLAKNPFI